MWVFCFFIEFNSVEFLFKKKKILKIWIYVIGYVEDSRILELVRYELLIRVRYLGN